MPDEMFDLKLYVAGQTPKAIRAFSNLRKICDEHLEGRYRIEVIDLLENPTLGQGDQILALPTLVRRLAQRSHRSHVASTQSSQVRSRVRACERETDGEDDRAR